MKTFFLFICLSAITIHAQDSIYNKPQNRRIRHYERTVAMKATTTEVFAFMDDINNTGMHMTRRRGAMMGSKLDFEWLSENKTGVGSAYHWKGKVAGMKLDFSVRVHEWERSAKKVWGTVGTAKLIVIDWFQMYLITSPRENGTSEARLGIYYTKHRGIWGFLLGNWYSKWCVKNMLHDTKKHFEKR